MLSSQDVNEASNVHVLELQQEVYEISLVYNINNPTEPNVWDGEAHSLSVFRTWEFLEINSKNMFTLLLCMANYIRSKKVLKDKANNILELNRFSKAT